MLSFKTFSSYKRNTFLLQKIYKGNKKLKKKVSKSFYEYYASACPFGCVFAVDVYMPNLVKC